MPEGSPQQLELFDLSGFNDFRSSDSTPRVTLSQMDALAEDLKRKTDLLRAEVRSMREEYVRLKQTESLTADAGRQGFKEAS